jgi:uncharacterized protein with PIN domain
VLKGTVQFALPSTPDARSCENRPNASAPVRISDARSLDFAAILRDRSFESESDHGDCALLSCHSAIDAGARTGAGTHRAYRRFGRGCTRTER